MPPRTVKKGVASTGSKKDHRFTRGASKSKNSPAEPVEEAVNVKEDSVPVVGAREDGKEDVVEAVKVDEKPTVEQKVESIEEYEKDERLELDDNEPEENSGEDYEEKEIGPDEVEYEIEEEFEEEQDGEEKDGDLSDYEDIHEVEGDADADDEHPWEEMDHAVLYDREEHDKRHEFFQERRKRKEFEVFVGGLDKDATEQDIRKVFSQVGEVVEVRLMMNPQTKNNKGFAFLRFATIDQVKHAFTELKNHVISGKQCGVTPSPDSDTLFLGNICRTWTKEAVRTIFIDCLPPWDEDHIRELLKKYGWIENIELAQNMLSAGRKDYDFVTFDTHDSAVTCAKRINNTELSEGDIKAKVRARLSIPHQRGRGNHISRDGFRSGRGSRRVIRGSWSCPDPRGFTPHVREYGQRDEIHPLRSRGVTDYGSKVVPDSQSSYREEYYSRNSGYFDLPRITSCTAERRPYVDDAYAQRFERAPPSYRDGYDHDYDMSGSKRPYVVMDDGPPRYVDAVARHSRARLDYGLAGGAPPFADVYGDRHGRSNLGYGGSRGSLSGQDSHGLYGSRHGMSYGGGLI
ncbi:RNA-binding family protein isoform 1 [Hibiscus syriacus]|uniref:RNA-binding family protein isoform 1 n=1 Tax=Hibiscus syriacus TaxID=106335 RepID=A0A6A2ZSC1_HIBSY|nr:RNA-binding family protein isoform 1 [Hibiscus syriacus]